MKTKSFEDYLKTRLTEEEINEVQNDAKEEVKMMKFDKEFKYVPAIFMGPLALTDALLHKSGKYIEIPCEMPEELKADTFKKFINACINNETISNVNSIPVKELLFHPILTRFLEQINE